MPPSYSPQHGKRVMRGGQPAAGMGEQHRQPAMKSVNSIPRSPTGGIQLPGGPEWAQLRRSFRPAPGASSLPRLKSIVLVEGHTDCNAVQRAVDSAVYVFGGSGIMTKQASEQLRRLATLGHELVVLTDPDREGNVLRDHLDNTLGSAVKHAFVSPELATSTVADDRHEEGNVGVEHAPPEAIRAALAGARQSHGPGRKEFSVEQLMELGLANSFDSREVVGAKLQRALLCRELGVGEAGGAALTKLLNRYFSREQFNAALSAAKSKCLKA